MKLEQDDNTDVVLALFVLACMIYSVYIGDKTMSKSDIFYLVLCAASIAYGLYRLNKCVQCSSEIKKQDKKDDDYTI